MTTCVLLVDYLPCALRLRAHHIDYAHRAVAARHGLHPNLGADALLELAQAQIGQARQVAEGEPLGELAEFVALGRANLVGEVLPALLLCFYEKVM